LIQYRKGVLMIFRQGNPFAGNNRQGISRICRSSVSASWHSFAPAVLFNIEPALFWGLGQPVFPHYLQDAPFDPERKVCHGGIRGLVFERVLHIASNIFQCQENTGYHDGKGSLKPEIIIYDGIGQQGTENIDGE
jgi:hypothetical protein